MWRGHPQLRFLPPCCAAPLEACCCARPAGCRGGGPAAQRADLHRGAAGRASQRACGAGTPGGGAGEGELALGAQGRAGHYGCVCLERCQRRGAPLPTAGGGCSAHSLTAVCLPGPAGRQAERQGEPRRRRGGVRGGADRQAPAGSRRLGLCCRCLNCKLQLTAQSSVRCWRGQSNPLQYPMPPPT